MEEYSRNKLNKMWFTSSKISSFGKAIVEAISVRTFFILYDLLAKKQDFRFINFKKKTYRTVPTVLVLYFTYAYILIFNFSKF